MSTDSNKSKCGFCDDKFARLKFHVRANLECLNYYKEYYNLDDIDRIFDLIRNNKKQEKRRSDKLLGKHRDRTVEINLRCNAMVIFKMAEQNRNRCLMREFRI